MITERLYEGVLVVLAIFFSAQLSFGQFSSSVTLGPNYSQILLDTRGNPTQAGLDHFHPSFGAQVEGMVFYSWKRWKVGLGLQLIYSRFYVDEKSFFNDLWPGDIRKDQLWHHYIICLPLAVALDLDQLNSEVEMTILNCQIEQDPLDSFGLDYPYSLGAGLSYKYSFSDDIFTEFSYTLLGMENWWKSEKGSHWYYSVFSLLAGYRIGN
jgi:hypothetical protein